MCQKPNLHVQYDNGQYTRLKLYIDSKRIYNEYFRNGSPNVADIYPTYHPNNNRNFQCTFDFKKGDVVVMSGRPSSYGYRFDNVSDYEFTTQYDPQSGDDDICSFVVTRDSTHIIYWDSYNGSFLWYGQ